MNTASSPTWAAATPPSLSAALARLARVDADRYARTRNHLDGAVTGLSPYLTHGLLTVPQVLRAVQGRTPLTAQHRLVAELGWREWFRHVWHHDGEAILHSQHSGPRPDRDYARALPSDIREGRTGLAVIDHAVRTLYETGTLHNHARLWLASAVVHLRHVHWRAGADWLVAHLADGDLASNHLSWQWVAGTGSHKPYLFNADNVARFAPPAWHSGGTALDRSYDDLARIATGEAPTLPAGPADLPGMAEPALREQPPPDLALGLPGEREAAGLAGRTVWLVHPWALRTPPADLPADALVIGVYLREHVARWPWPAVRWRWVDAAMSAVAPRRWWVDAATLGRVLEPAGLVRSVDDPHVRHLLPRRTRLDAAPTLFPMLPSRCTSFSQWWSRVTRDRHSAAELLDRASGC